MSSLLPQQSQPSRTAARRRQRSTRLSAAVALLGLSALLVLGAVVSGSLLFACLAGVAAVALGGAATKMTNTELAESRVEAARDRAEQARAYAELTERKTAENVAFALDMRRKIAAREEVIAGLEKALINSQRLMFEQTRKLGAEARRADTAERTLADSEDRAAHAIVLVAELEAEIDVLRAELTSWRTARPGKRASSA
ncbi:MAG: putative multidomain rane protein [Nocardioides sp.]|jgi:hypothetical protein|uniref:hypothetical protein n=1 Tax=Nocardioides sp. TaxID=35761 RepID=UPI0026259E30|nr:hypothetical protein [Nocardioides sp.]MCW2832125.1 putative multidomain rane protein [Nocardioides sp.]